MRKEAETRKHYKANYVRFGYQTHLQNKQSWRLSTELVHWKLVGVTNPPDFHRMVNTNKPHAFITPTGADNKTTFFCYFFCYYFFYSQTLNLTKQTVNTHTMGRCEGSLVCKWMLTLRSQWCYCMLNHYLKSLWTRLAYHSSRMNTRAQAGTIRIVAPKKRLNVYAKCKWKELLCKRSFVIYSWSSSGVFIFFKNVCIYLFIFTS